MTYHRVCCCDPIDDCRTIYVHQNGNPLDEVVGEICDYTGSAFSIISGPSFLSGEVSCDFANGGPPAGSGPCTFSVEFHYPTIVSDNGGLCTLMRNFLSNGGLSFWTPLATSCAEFFPQDTSGGQLPDIGQVTWQLNSNGFCQEDELGLWALIQINIKMRCEPGDTTAAGYGGYIRPLWARPICNNTQDPGCNEVTAPLQELTGMTGTYQFYGFSRAITDFLQDDPESGIVQFPEFLTTDWVVGDPSLALTVA